MRWSGRIQHLWLFQLLADIAAVVAAYYTTFLIRFHSESGDLFFSFINRTFELRETGELTQTLEQFYLVSAPRIILQILATVIVLYALLDLYPGRRFIRKRPVSWSVILANSAAILLFYTYFYLMRNVFHPRSLFAIVIFFNVLYCVIFRSAMDRFLTFLRSTWGIDRIPALLLGTGPTSKAIADFIEAVHPHGICISDQMELHPTRPIEEQMRQAEARSRDGGVELVICARDDLSVSQVMQLLEMTDRLNIPAKVLSPKLDVLHTVAAIPVDLVQGVPLVHFDTPGEHRKTALRQRAFSILIGSLLFLLCLPLLILLAALIRFTSRGPVVFRQERIGVNRKPFLMYKFRTMYDGADELRAEIEELNDAGGGLFKIKRDPRVTPLGRLLRRFSLDELPQLLNIIKGDMVVVGPRPLPRADFRNYYEEWHYSRHSGMPGLTCLWQVSGRSDVSFHNMCILDIYYLRNRNWIMDVKIVVKTFWVVLFAKGAY